MSNRFYVNEEFPSFMPIRANAQKILSVIDAAIAGTTDSKNLDYLNSLKAKVTAADPTDLFYFTVANAQLLKLV